MKRVPYRISAELIHVHTNSTTNTDFNMIDCLSDCCLAADEFLIRIEWCTVIGWKLVRTSSLRVVECDRVHLQGFEYFDFIH